MAPRPITRGIMGGSVLLRSLDEAMEDKESAMSLSPEVEFGKRSPKAAEEEHEDQEAQHP